MTSAFDVALGRYIIVGGGLTLSRTDLNVPALFVAPYGKTVLEPNCESSVNRTAGNFVRMPCVARVRPIARARMTTYKVDQEQAENKQDDGNCQTSQGRQWTDTPCEFDVLIICQSKTLRSRLAL